jgi:tetratricopeptide (TPR) repeat protein
MKAQEDLNRQQSPARAVSSPIRRQRWLLASLLVLGALYLAMLPWRRHMAMEVARIDRETELRQREERRLRDLRGALVKAQEDVAHSPGDAGAHMQLAAQYHSVGRLEDAAQQAEIAAGLSPQDIAPLLMLADIQQHAHHFDAAIRAYKTTLVRQPGNLQASVGLSYLYVLLGWPQEADAVLEPVVRANPQNPQAKVALALSYVQQSHDKEAERLLREARQLAPQDAALWTPLVHLYNIDHRYADAVSVGRDALLLLPQNVALMDGVGQSYYHLNSYSDALQMFDRALSLSPDDIDAHYYRGLCYQKQKQREKAIEELETVLHKGQDFEQTRQILGTLYMQSHRDTEGQRLLAEAKSANLKAQERTHATYLVANQPRSAAAHWQMAQIYVQDGDRNRAIVELEKTLELDPNQEKARSLRDRLQPEKARTP